MSKPRIYCLTIIGLILLVILYLASLWNYLSGEVRQNNRIGTLYESIQQRPDGTVSKALVTLFTTFDDDPDGVNIRINVLHNWSRMRPEAKLILFVWHDGIPPNLASTARSLGWTVKLLRRVSHSGKAFVKDLYRAAMEQHDTPFYGFVSGDILFDGGLLTTLRLVRAELPFLGSTLVIGRRHNAFVGDDTKVSSFSDVARLAKDHGLLYRVDVLDYFVTSRGYPWPHFADVTVGRPAFDSYIAGLAVINGMKVVDATATVTALHQCRAPSKNGGEVPVYSDRHNLIVIGSDFDFNQGSTLMATYETALIPNGLVDLRERNERIHKGVRHAKDWMLIIDRTLNRQIMDGLLRPLKTKQRLDNPL